MHSKSIKLAEYNTSAVQRLMSRRTKTPLVINPGLLQPEIDPNI